jgi:DNA-binding MarR family transcriptional regulator
MPSTDSDIRFAIMRLSRQIKQQKAEGELSDGQRSVLFFLLDHGAQSLGSLSERDRVTPPSMNRTVGALVELGLVTRDQATDDARKVRIDLTEEGRRVILQTRRKREKWFSERMSQLTPEERAAILAAIPALIKLAEA